MRLLSLGMVLLLWVSGCGQAEPTRPRPPATPVPVAPLPAPAADPGADRLVRQIVGGAIARLDAVKTIEGRVRFEEWEGDSHDVGAAKFTFRKKPFMARVDVEQSNRLLAAGTTVFWSGGTTVKVKPLKLPLTLTFDYDDNQVVSLRGYRLDQTDLFSMGKVLAHPQAQVRPLGPKRLGSEDFFLLEVRSPASVAGVDREVIGINQRHNVPTYREMYAGSRLVHKGRGENLRFDHAIDGDKFEP